jgi:hypothetical protein
MEPERNTSGSSVPLRFKGVGFSDEGKNARATSMLRNRPHLLYR